MFPECDRYLSTTCTKMSQIYPGSEELTMSWVREERKHYYWLCYNRCNYKVVCKYQQGDDD